MKDFGKGNYNRVTLSHASRVINFIKENGRANKGLINERCLMAPREVSLVLSFLMKWELIDFDGKFFRVKGGI